ncbi:hypothetical protein [Filimonas effusa]|uniref:Uncharacterized protein n=1 Tax=Filimonas effusa TaxID=2508721 RepID=A0A4Q1DEN2_9BACT|nr:hypothetical protein [Filimonas effusa]RXK87069.1 hypothetical protein ESB13_09870 [Filimonas effusa]
MKLNITTGILLLCAVVSGCKKEAVDTTPSGIIDTYTLPQGNHDFDTRIVSYHQQYGTYLLYQFTDRDVYWSPTANTKPTMASTGFWSTGVEVAPANVNYISAQLDLIQSQWFSYYSDKFLKEFLPSKILLCSKLDSVYAGYVFVPVFAYSKVTKPIPAYYNYDNITVGFGSDTITKLTATDKRNFMARTNSQFIKSIASRTLSVPPVTFSSSVNYGVTYTSQGAAYAQGILQVYYNGLTAQGDWNAYMAAMVNYSEKELNTSVADTDATAAGILNATKDKNGKIRQRYNMVRNYFINEYQVDLQKIGNAAKGQ